MVFIWFILHDAFSLMGLHNIFYFMHFCDGFTWFILFGAFFRWVYMIYFIWCVYSMCLHDLFYLMHFFDGFTWFIWHDALSSMGLHDIFYLMHFFDGFTWFILFKFMHLVDGFKFPALLLRWFCMLVRAFLTFKIISIGTNRISIFVVSSDAHHTIINIM